MTEPDRIVRLPELITLVGLHETTIWRMERKDQFPKRIHLTPRAVGWKLSAIRQWMAEREAA